MFIVKLRFAELNLVFLFFFGSLSFIRRGPTSVGCYIVDVGTHSERGFMLVWNGIRPATDDAIITL